MSWQRSKPKVFSFFCSFSSDVETYQNHGRELLGVNHSRESYAKDSTMIYSSASKSDNNNGTHSIDDNDEFIFFLHCCQDDLLLASFNAQLNISISSSIFFTQEFSSPSLPARYEIKSVWIFIPWKMKLDILVGRIQSFISVTSLSFPIFFLFFAVVYEK